MRRHHSRFAAAPLFLVALFASACAPAAHPGPQPASPGSTTSTLVAPIAWLDAPTPAPAAASPTTPAAARPCTAADLPATATYHPTGGISQTDSDIVELGNVGPSPCTLDVLPQLLYTDQGQVRSLPTVQNPAWVQPDFGPATIAPGQTATLLVLFSRACPAAQRSYADIVLVQAGKQIPVPGLKLTGTCANVELGAWEPPQQPDPIPPRLQYGTLPALVDAPATAHAGDPIDYVVTLTNPGPATVTFTPCPVYRESIYKLSITYLLNCPPAGLAPGDSIRFAMRITPSAYTPAGPTTLRWTIVEPGGESATASAPIDITQPS